jgi:hypothetical protein
VGCKCAVGLVEGRCFLCWVLHGLGIERVVVWELVELVGVVYGVEVFERVPGLELGTEMISIELDI